MKKGFTLIELLAVIVILAIIALIALPIILNIIGDAREEAKQRSVENYLSTVELYIAKANLESEFNPNTCTIEKNGNLLCDGDKILNVKVEGEFPSGGYISLKNGKVESYSLIIDEETIENTEINPLVVESYYSGYGVIGYEPTTPTINDNSISSLVLPPGNTFRIDLPKSGYSFNWTISGQISIYFYPYSNPTKKETINTVSNSSVSGEYFTNEAGYVVFSGNGGNFSINNFMYNNSQVIINYIKHPTTIKQVSTGCYIGDRVATCENNIQNNTIVTQPIYVFVDSDPWINPKIQLNDGEWQKMSKYSQNNAYFQITEPGTYKIKVALSAYNVSNSQFWPSEEYFNVTIAE